MTEVQGDLPAATYADLGYQAQDHVIRLSVGIARQGGTSGDTREHETQ
jgi:hypothetical protein